MPTTPTRRRRTRSGLSARPNRIDSTRTRKAAVEPARRRRRASALRPRGRRKIRILVITLAVIAALAGGGVAAAFVAYASYRAQLPDAATVSANEPPLDSHVFDTLGNLIAVYNDVGVRHVHTSLESIAKYAQLATIDVEDRHFYSEGSWDLPRLVKAGWDNLRHTNTSGASTIVEQLAKISFFNSAERSLDYKVKEIVLGNEIDANFTKQQILEMYLNRVPYGNHAIGIETAAELYFFKSAKDLTLAEASLLSGLPQSPSYYNPTVHDASTTINPAAKSRQRVVLDAMVSNGDITQQQADVAFATPLSVHSWTESNPNPYYDVREYVKGWLSDHYGNAFINPGGWDIYTTIDPVKQQAAETALRNGINLISKDHNARDGAIVNIDPKAGKLLAMVGAYDYNDPYVGETNMAVRPRSTGSTIKLFTYSAAIASHLFTMTTPIVDAPIHLVTNPGQPAYSPLNYDRRWHGTCEVKTCLGNSLNVPAVKVEVATGIPYISSLEISAGLTSMINRRPGPRDYYATLGGVEVSPLEMAVGAATIADLGVHHDPSPVDHIVDRVSGKTFFTLDPSSSARQVIPANVAFIIDEITSNDANRVMDFGPRGPLTLPDRRVSAKTGTAQFFLDNWTVGWTPDVVSTVWIGNPTNSCVTPADRQSGAINTALRRHPGVPYTDATPSDPFSPADLRQLGLTPVPQPCGHLDNSSGITGAAPIWNQDMKTILKGVAPTWYTVPKDVVQVGTGDNADFFLPGTQSTPGGTGCYFFGPDPTQIPPGLPPTCQYRGVSGNAPFPGNGTGTGAPSPAPQPTAPAAPASGNPAPAILPAPGPANNVNG